MSLAEQRKYSEVADYITKHNPPAKGELKPYLMDQFHMLQRRVLLAMVVPIS